MIPKTIHQIWIGELPAPQDLIDSWRRLNPGWDHFLWTSQHARIASVRRANEATIETLALPDPAGGGGWRNAAAIEAVRDHAARSDLMRYEILEAFGGVYVDADSECLRPLDEDLLDYVCWATFENETVRPGIITGAFMASVPGSSLMKELIRKAPFRDLRGQPGWKSVGPMFLTEAATEHPELSVLPSYLFTPEHYTRTASVGEEPPFARHVWGNTLGYARLGKVSAVIACKGEEDFLEDAVRSLAQQTRLPDEIVIVCGDEPSRLAAIGCREYYTGNTIRVVVDEGNGPGAARNVGIKVAAGPMILLLDADDIAEPTLLAECLAHARGNRPIVTTHMRLFGERNGVKCAGVAALPNPQGILNENPIGCSALFPKSLWELAGGYDETLPDYEDWDFWIRCCRHRPVVSILPEPLVRYRQHGVSRMAAVRSRPGRDAELRSMIRERHADLYGQREAPTKADRRRPEELSATWRPEILGLGSDGILTFYRRVARELPAGAKCVCLGVFHGRDLLYLAELLHELGNMTAELSGVDLFLYYGGSLERTRENAARVLTWPGGPTVSLHPISTLAASKLFDDGSLDLVFIDAAHDRASVAADIGAWLPKLKASGLMAGHDYGHPDFGVKAAVDEAFGSKVRYEGATVWSVRP